MRFPDPMANTCRQLNLFRDMHGRSLEGKYVTRFGNTDCLKREIYSSGPDMHVLTGYSGLQARRFAVAAPHLGHCI